MLKVTQNAQIAVQYGVLLFDANDDKYLKRQN